MKISPFGGCRSLGDSGRVGCAAISSPSQVHPRHRVAPVSNAGAEQCHPCHQSKKGAQGKVQSRMQWLARLILLVQELKLKIQIGKTLQEFASFAVFEQLAKQATAWHNKLQGGTASRQGAALMLSDAISGVAGMVAKRGTVL
jgi:hypothetical protein